MWSNIYTNFILVAYNLENNFLLLTQVQIHHCLKTKIP
jgi:hypothetical protein